MRVFIGVDLPDDVRATAGEISARVQARMRGGASGASIRWIDPANLHVTLWFIGEVDDTRLAQIRQAASEPLRTRAFRLRFAGLGAFPPSGVPRVLWIGIESGVEQLQSLHAELQPRLAALGIEGEPRPYSPHLTIARIKEIRRSDANSLRAGLNLAVEPFGAPVTAVTLFQSRQSPRGSQYEPLLRVPLA
jgi:RNA 2',3'-cyclic 3'-phosphodiesterase